MAARVSFSGHETFPLRFNWLKKAVDAATSDPEIFSADRAIAEFGVGKNMVRSIRHWGLACGVLSDHPGLNGAYEATSLGRQLFGSAGWDPYLEDIGTTWLLHWHLCAHPEPSPLWHFLFAEWGGRELSITRIKPLFADWAEAQEISLPADSTLKRDLKCLLGTYSARRSKHDDLEAALGSPFNTLNLIHEVDGVHQFRRGLQPSLPAEIFVYAVLRFWKDRRPEAKSISIQEVLQEGGSPGRIFKIAENRAFDLLLQVDAWEAKPFTYRDSAGNRQLFRIDESVTADTILEQYYARTFSQAIA